MSIHLRIPSLQERRPSFQSRSRNLIRSSSPPRSPALRRDICEAVESDGQPCNTPLPSEEDDWCPRHAQDLRDMNMAWDKVQKEAERIEVRDPYSARQKMQKLQLAMNLRRRLRERFYTRGVDTLDYTKWIAKVETDTRQLADALLSRLCSLCIHYIVGNFFISCSPRTFWLCHDCQILTASRQY
jgi:hypothetical protein